MLVLSALLGACQTSAAPEAGTTANKEQTAPADKSGDVQASPADSVEATGDATAAGLGDAVAAAPPEPDVPAEPEPLKAPDGTLIEPCGEPPEGMVCILGGPFIRGYDDDPHSECKQPSYNLKHVTNTQPAETIWMQTYYMDKIEVTYGAYKACEERGDCDKAAPLYRDFDRPEQPMTGMNWFDSRKFCQAHGKHLPTEAEWEKAARGPDGDLYPWGNDPPADCSLAVIMDEKGRRSCGIEKIGYKPEKGRVLEGCTRPEGHYGLCDMVGNAEEWVNDWYTHSWEDCGEDCQGFHPRGPCNGEDECPFKRRYKVVRGGSWYWPAEHGTSIHRRSHVPGNDPYHHYGFRCAASVEEVQKMQEP